MTHLDNSESNFGEVSPAMASADVLFELGLMYCIGREVEQDYVTAHKWFNLAAVGGHAEAQMCRADISEEMTAREIAEAQRRARQWLSQTQRKAA